MSTRQEIELLRALLHGGEEETPKKPAPVDSQDTTFLQCENYSQEQEKQLNWTGDPAETPKSLQGFSYGAIQRMWIDGELDPEEAEWFSYKSPPGGELNLKLILNRQRRLQNGKEKISD